MKYTEHFDQIVTQISSHQTMFNEEILTLYPDGLDIFKDDWVKQLDLLSDEELWKIDCFQDESVLSDGEFKNWILDLKKLCTVPSYNIQDLKSLPDFAFNKVKAKKRHEILILAKFLTGLKEKINFTHLVDIGGGVGHLSRVMAHYFGIECISLDINHDFQQSGLKRLEKYKKPEIAKDVTFITHDFSKDLDGEITKKIFTKKSFSLGLHTCGPLANKHIQLAIQNETQGLINFGCCYLKLDPNSDLNLSSYAKENGLKLSSYALTLASRGHSSMDYNSFQLKKRVKDYRYAIHILLYEEFGQKNVEAVGENEASIYWLDFSVYAKEKLKKRGIDHNLSDEYLNEFFGNDKMQKYLRYLFLCNVIRWQYGRILEFYILIDRCIYLEENGKRPSLIEFFDQHISPRNIAIYTLQ